jgi:hypothetical protein
MGFQARKTQSMTRDAALSGMRQRGERHGAKPKNRLLISHLMDEFKPLGERMARIFSGLGGNTIG